MINPYENKNEDEWFDITCNLIKNHPLDMDIMVDTVLETWEDIFNSSFGKNDIRLVLIFFQLLK